MAKVNVNPPPILKRPRDFIADNEKNPYFRDIETILFQLWNRTGGDNDKIEDTQNQISNGNTSLTLNALKELGSGVEFTMDTAGFTFDSTKITFDKVIA